MAEFLHWALSIVGLCLVIYGLSNIDRMTNKTDHMIRISSVLTTAGATLMVITHIGALFGSPPLCDDIPVLMAFIGVLLHTFADRRRRDMCATADCSFRRKDG